MAHEIRDPIHTFIELDEDERRVLDSEPVQRLRNIHQLAMSYLVYPGATHKRFEHSLGVMELAGRIFDVVTDDQNVHDAVRDDIVPEISQSDSKSYWRKVVRMAALCHDIGHLPFSHAAEKDLLPKGWSHELITKDLILSDELHETCQSMTPPMRAIDVAKVAVGKEKMPDEDFTTWEAICSEIITGEAFGADRMDYLLRDSHHAGVAYGRFDHYRLIDTLRILPDSTLEDGSFAPALGVESGGLHTAEALLLARYFMFMQVYHHPVRIAYDCHLGEFLKAWLHKGRFSTVASELQLLTDNEVLAEISKAANDPVAPGHADAVRISKRQHFRTLYTQTRGDKEKFEDPVALVAKACIDKYGKDKIRYQAHRQSDPATNFPVVRTEGGIDSSLELSHILTSFPNVDVGVVLVDPEIIDEAANWFQTERDKTLNLTG